MNPLAVISSGTRGIGRATVLLFLKNGFDVVTGSRKQVNIDRLAADVKGRGFAGQLHAVAADLSEEKGVEALVKFVQSLDRPVDVLVNNTGLFVPGQIHSEAPGVLEKIMNANLFSAYHLTRGLVSGMIAKRSGHIFTMCSIASITAYPNGGAYAIAKHALYGMTKVLRQELRTHNVRVTAILPGATLTDSWAGTDLPPERFMKSEDVASAIWSAYQLSEGTVLEELILRPQLGDI
jgi:short-subunit dehydrogenase